MRFAVEFDELLAYAVMPRESRAAASAVGSAIRRTDFILMFAFHAGATGGVSNIIGFWRLVG
jgi:hypothetical protein